MPKIKKEEVLSHPKPHELFLDQENLIASVEELDSIEDKEALISKVIMGCPPSDLNKIAKNFDGLRGLSGGKERTFYEQFTKGLSLHAALMEMLDASNKTAHMALTSKHFSKSSDLFTSFPDMVRQVSAGKEQELAIRLAAYCPIESLGHLNRNAELAFGRESAVRAELSKAIAVRQELHNMLNTRNWMVSKEHDADVFNRFPAHFKALSEGSDIELAKNLVLNTSAGHRAAFVMAVNGSFGERSEMSQLVQAGLAAKTTFDTIVRNPAQLLNAHFNYDALHQFYEVPKALIEGQEQELAKSMVAKLAPESLGAFNFKISQLFRDTELPKAVNKAIVEAKPVFANSKFAKFATHDGIVPAKPDQDESASKEFDAPQYH